MFTCILYEYLETEVRIIMNPNNFISFFYGVFRLADQRSALNIVYLNLRKSFENAIQFFYFLFILKMFIFYLFPIILKNNFNIYLLKF